MIRRYDLDLRSSALISGVFCFAICHLLFAICHFSAFAFSSH